MIIWYVASSMLFVRCPYIAMLFPRGHQHGIDFVIDKKTLGFLNPIFMVMWENPAKVETCFVVI